MESEKLTAKEIKFLANQQVFMRNMGASLFSSVAWILISGMNFRYGCHKNLNLFMLGFFIAAFIGLLLQRHSDRRYLAIIEKLGMKVSEEKVQERIKQSERSALIILIVIACVLIFTIWFNCFRK